MRSTRTSLHRSLLAAAWLLAGLGACAADPVGQPEQRAAREAVFQVEAALGLMRDPDLLEYVTRIGARLALGSTRRDVRFHFQIADTSEPSAFALPAGQVFVSRGLLLMANSEDELANVLAHEIAHVDADHHAQREMRVHDGMRVRLGQLLAILRGPGSRPALHPDGTPEWLAAYNRQQELESDRIGQALAARAGWDPAGLGTFLAALEARSQLDAADETRDGFLETHPSTGERVHAARDHALRLERAAPRPIASTRRAYLQRVRGLRVGTDPAHGVLDGATFRHPDLDFLVRFPRGWTTGIRASVVSARSPHGDALISLQLEGSGDDPREPARRLVRGTRVGVLRDGALNIGGLQAYNVVAAHADGVADLTWIAYQGRVYRLGALSSAHGAERYRALFQRTVRSFRPLRREERAGLLEHFLEIATAGRDETLAQLSARTRNSWSLERTAVMNGLREDAVLARGAKIKIARARAYEPSS